MNNHGHVRPNQDGSRARCGGPGICMECSLEANAYKLSAMGGCNSCNDLRSKLSAAEKERDELKAKLAVAVEALKEFSYCHFDGSKNGHVCGVGCDMGGAGHPTDERGHDVDCLFKKATEALKAINGGESG